MGDGIGLIRLRYFQGSSDNIFFFFFFLNQCLHPSMNGEEFVLSTSLLFGISA